MCARKLKYSSGDELPLYATPEEAMREGNRREEEERRRRQMEHQKPKYGQQVGVGMHQTAPPETQGIRMNSNPQIPVGNNNGMGYPQQGGYQSSAPQYGHRIPSSEQYGYHSQTQGQAPHAQGKPQMSTQGQMKPPMINKYSGTQSLTSQTTPQPVMRQQVYSSQPRPHSQPQPQQHAGPYGTHPQPKFAQSQPVQPVQPVQQVQQHPSHSSPSHIQYSQAQPQPHQYTHGGSHQYSQASHQQFIAQPQQQHSLSQPQSQQQPAPQSQHHRNGLPQVNGQMNPYVQSGSGSGNLAPVQPVNQNAQTLAPAPTQQPGQQRVPQTLAPSSHQRTHLPVAPTQQAASQKQPNVPASQQQRGDSRSFVNPVPTANNNVSNTSYAAVGNNHTGEDHDATVARKLFQNHDVRKLERLTADELQNLLQNDDNTQFCMSSVQALISLFGVSRFGTVNLAEFTSLYKRVKKWRMVYVDNDINGSFTISSSEYHNSLQELGYLVPFEVSEKLFDQYAEYMNNNKHTKELKFDKFVESLVWLMRLTKVFRKYDTHQDGIATIHFKDFIETSLYLGKFLPR